VSLLIYLDGKGSKLLIKYQSLYTREYKKPRRRDLRRGFCLYICWENSEA